MTDPRTTEPQARPRPPRRPKDCTSIQTVDVDMNHPDPCPNCFGSEVLMVESTPKIVPADTPSTRQRIVYAVRCSRCARRTEVFATPDQAIIAWQTQTVLRCRCKRCMYHNPTASDYIEYLGDPAKQHRMFQIV